MSVIIEMERLRKENGQLREEVERQRLIISGKTQCDERKAAALRCAEIANKTAKVAQAKTSYAEGWRDGCDQAARNIKKEYGL